MTNPPSSVLIVGAGLAGAKTAEALRDQGFAGAITLLGSETHLPYERPPLSKDYLLGKAELDAATVHPAEWYREHDVELLLGTEVAAIHPDTHEIELAGGQRLGYGALVLATGSEPRKLPLPGADADGVHVLRTREDSEAIRDLFGAERRLAVIGAGWIGLEVAAAACEHGTAVTIFEAAELPLLAVLGPEMGAVFAELHRDHGVNLRLGASIAEISASDGRADGIVLADGTRVPADAVIMGVGVRPRVELARAAGLDVDDGVLVDAALRASAPDVYAVGDIAAHDHPVLRRRIRVEHWATALNQPATAAAAILGADKPYENLPYFFSDQYDLGMEYVGFAGPGDDTRVIVRGDLGKREFVAFWLDPDHHLLAAMNVNVWDVPDAVKPLIAGRVVVDPAKLADPDVPYAEVGAA
ncbi:MAG TPA: FAD-dependent oxidoreductase [Jatrophihabitans sp.]|nr:FAD-dependent oxidoreductase [Jatrophihabitans sp.]